jgi:glycosyltransferase involved in cell wall biosynthesis
MTPVIVIPVHNEAATIADVVAGARRHAPVIVVDDGSSDDSAAEAIRAGADVIRHAGRRGKGAALRRGIAAARTRGATAVVTLDGDGQHAPGDVPLLLRALDETPDRLVIGDRLAHTAGFARARLNAMVVAAFFVEWVSALGVRDTQSGFRAYPMPLLDDVRTARGGFVFETEVLVRAAQRGWRAREVSVASIPSARRRSRFRPLRDGLAIGAFLTGQSLHQWGRVVRARVRAGLRPPRGRARPRRARAAAIASSATPLLLAAAALQVGLGRLGIDLVTPLVWRFYARERLTGATSAVADGGGESLAALEAPLATSPGGRT